MTDPEDMDARLARLAKATEGVAPRAGFSARVMGAVGAAKPAETSWLADLPRTAWRLLPVAALAAVLGVTWAVHSAHTFDDALASSYDAVELDW